MKHNPWIYIAVMSAVTLGIRIIPLTLLRKRIRNRYLRSFLFYIPYITLSVMTFPAILEAVSSPWAGAAALAAGILAAWFGATLFQTAILCCVIVFGLELFLIA